MSTPILNNLGTNYNAYYNFLNFFKTIMSNHPSIQTVTQGDVFEIDDREFPAYPLGNVLVTNVSVEGTETIYTVQLTVADKIKLKNNESEGVYNKQNIPYFGTDDTVDIHSNTYGIISDLTNYVARGTYNFDIVGNINCEPFKDRFDNGLAGWVATFEVTTHNDRNRCLFFLVNPQGTGYRIQNCETSEVYNAVLTGSILPLSASQSFISSWPEYGSCYNVQSVLTDFDNWDLVNLPASQSFVNCTQCTNQTTASLYNVGTFGTGDRWITYRDIYGQTIVSSSILNFNTAKNACLVNTIISVSGGVTADYTGPCS